MLRQLGKNLQELLLEDEDEVTEPDSGASTSNWGSGLLDDPCCEERPHFHLSKENEAASSSSGNDASKKEKLKISAEEAIAVFVSMLSDQEDGVARQIPEIAHLKQVTTTSTGEEDIVWSALQLTHGLLEALGVIAARFKDEKCNNEQDGGRVHQSQQNIAAAAELRAEQLRITVQAREHAEKLLAASLSEKEAMGMRLSESHKLVSIQLEECQVVMLPGEAEKLQNLVASYTKRIEALSEHHNSKVKELNDGLLKFQDEAMGLEKEKQEIVEQLQSWKAAHGAASEEIQKLSLELESWKAAHGTASEEIQKLSLELADLRSSRAAPSVEEELREAKKFLESYRKADADLRWKDDEMRHVKAERDCALSNLDASKEALTRLNDVIENMQTEHETSMGRLENSLHESRSALCVSQDRNIEIERERAEAEQLREDMRKLQEDSSNFLNERESSQREIRNYKLSVESLVQRLQREMDERENLIDRRIVKDFLRSYVENELSRHRLIIEEQRPPS